MAVTSTNSTATAGMDRDVATQNLNAALQDKGFLLTSTEHRLAALDDLWSGVLRGRDDAHLHAAL